MRRQATLGRIETTLHIHEPIPNIHGVIIYFDKTPSDIACPHFWELRWAFGCPFNCAYCYLQGTSGGLKTPRPSNMKMVFKAIDDAFNHPYFQTHPSIFNSGELSDSLMFPETIAKIADKFEQQKDHYLLLLTKDTNINFLLDKPRKQTIVSFSLSSEEVWKLWENNTPSPLRRVEAASQLQNAGYEVRVRIDPIFPIEGWRAHYSKLLEFLFIHLPKGPERITLGMPRGLKKTLIYSKDRSWAEGLTEKSGWGLKLPTGLRREVYIFFIENLEAFNFDISKVALCKETLALCQELKIGQRCNCVW